MAGADRGAFYRATAVDPLGVDFRRRFTLDDGEIIAYLDEHLDDPEGGEVAGGIPDPVLAEIGAERSGEMREIVSTIQAEQDVVIRSSIDQVLVVQGGPGTGKTAVALHRAAFLLFEHRRRLARDGVLVIGPNHAFLDYISNVLPSLGERTVRQATVDELCIPRVDVTGADDVEAARWKGSAERLADLESLALEAIRPPDADIRVPIGARTHVIDREMFAEWLETAKGGTSPLNQRRERVRSMAQRELLRRTGGDEAWAKAAPLKAAINTAWPTQKPVQLVDRLLPGRSGKRRAWTRADQLLVDEANSLLNGSPFTYGHVDRRRGPGPLCGRAPGHRSPQPVRIDDAGRRRRPVDDPGGPGAVVRSVRASRGRRRCGHRRRPDDRLPRPRADPAHRQPTAAVHRRRGDGEPQRPQGGRAAVVAAGDDRGAGRGRRGARVRHQATTPGQRASSPRSSCTMPSPPRFEVHGLIAVDHVHELAGESCPSSVRRR